MAEGAAPLWAALAWILWCAGHSLAIDSCLARWCRRLLGPYGHRYRLCYNLVSLVSAAALGLWCAGLPARLLLVLPSWTLALRLPLAAYALFMFVAGGRAYDSRVFLGIARETEAKAAPTLQTAGILGVVRHPWYSGGLALLLTPGRYTDVGLAVHLVLAGYILMGTGLEERRLLARFGAAYRRYQARVPMLLPRWPGRR